MRRPAALVLLALLVPAVASAAPERDRDTDGPVAKARRAHGATRPDERVVGGALTVDPAEGLAGVLRTVDVPAFVLMAEHYALALRAIGEIADNDYLTTEDRNGAERKLPQLQVFRDNAAAYRMFATEFGLTPSSRARIHVQGDGEQLSLADELFSMIGNAVEVGNDD